MGQLHTFDWTVFTSANAVRFLWQRMRELGLDARSFAGVRLAAVGAATAKALAECGLIADLVPERYDAAALGGELRARGLACVGNIPPTPALPRVLLPQADNARSTLREWLSGQGCPVTAVVAYRTIPVAVPASLDLTGIAAVTFASSATVERFIAAVGRPAVDALVADGCRFFAIGPQTAATMAAQSIPLCAMAQEAGVQALVQAVIEHLGQP